MDFVSNKLEKLRKAAKVAAILALSYASLGNSYTKGYTENTPSGAQTFQIEYNHVDYKAKPNVRSVPSHYFGPSVVAFTRPEDGEVAVPPIEHVPYENGVHSWEFVLHHELMHNYIHQAGGIQDERGINDAVAYRLGPKYCIDRFPFSSY